ncbi:MAG: hypothetical protein K8U03_25080 [Planctomycetia bacterium]|nr:hypothetical protein [Planctomycetia bacterium]
MSEDTLPFVKTALPTDCLYKTATIVGVVIAAFGIAIPLIHEKNIEATIADVRDLESSKRQVAKDILSSLAPLRNVSDVAKSTVANARAISVHLEGTTSDIAAYNAGIDRMQVLTKKFKASEEAVKNIKRPGKAAGPPVPESDKNNQFSPDSDEGKIIRRLQKVSEGAAQMADEYEYMKLAMTAIQDCQKAATDLMTALNDQYDLLARVYGQMAEIKNLHEADPSTASTLRDINEALKEAHLIATLVQVNDARLDDIGNTLGKMVVDRDFYDQVGLTVFAFGMVWIVTGIVVWYRKVQKWQDRLIMADVLVKEYQLRRSQIADGALKTILTA